jgi:hypothetical protein
VNEGAVGTEVGLDVPVGLGGTGVAVSATVGVGVAGAVADGVGVAVSGGARYDMADRVVAAVGRTSSVSDSGLGRDVAVDRDVGVSRGVGLTYWVGVKWGVEVGCDVGVVDCVWARAVTGTIPMSSPTARASMRSNVDGGGRKRRRFMPRKVRQDHR